MIKFISVIFATVFLIACSDPKNTALPDDVSKMESVKTEFEKLKPEEKQLVLGYLMRRGISGILPGMTKNNPPMTATTFGQAIDQQKEFISKSSLRDAEDKAAAGKIKIEQEAATKTMRELVSIGMISKSVDSVYGASGMELDRALNVSFSFQNKSSKEIAGVKGLITALDQFGDVLSKFQISLDDGIKANASTIWKGSRSVKYVLGGNEDAKFASLPDEKVSLIWTPQAIIFSDGTKLLAPDIR